MGSNPLPVFPKRLVVIMEIDFGWPVDLTAGFQAQVIGQMKRFCLRLEAENEMKFIGYPSH
jgi:hypothetical protein